MPLVKSIIPKKIKALDEKVMTKKTTALQIPLIYKLVLACGLQLIASSFLFAQDNSPYSRYGLGDISPRTNILNRGMAGITAATTNRFSINFTNPASYSAFEAATEARTNKVSLGRVVLDVGVNFDTRTLREADKPDRFTASNLFVSYLQLGVPIRKNWGINFGLRPLTKIQYNIIKRERLFDPLTNLPIDSAETEFVGDGGAFLAAIGTGVAVKNFSFGINFGYMFGKKDYSTKRVLINDSVAYNRSNHQTSSSFGDIYLDGGIQFTTDPTRIATNKIVFQAGVYGSMKQTIGATRDVIRETFTRNTDVGDFRLDSVSESLNEKGTLVYPSTIGTGVTVERRASREKGGWLVGADYVMHGWDDYRFFGETDRVRSNWTFKLGGQMKPRIPASNPSYWNFVEYRAGVSIGEDYVYLDKKLPELGISFGMGLPVLYLKDPGRARRTQQTLINISMEYIKRGNNENLLKEDMFRLSVGFSFSDFWFQKRKYD